MAWGFLTNHAQALLCIAQDPGVRLREIATALGITERAAFGIVTDLVEPATSSRQTQPRNHYQVKVDQPLPEAPAADRQPTARFLLAYTGEGTATPQGLERPAALIRRPRLMPAESRASVFGPPFRENTSTSTISKPGDDRLQDRPGNVQPAGSRRSTRSSGAAAVHSLVRRRPCSRKYSLPARREPGAACQCGPGIRHHASSADSAVSKLASKRQRLDQIGARDESGSRSREGGLGKLQAI